MAQSFKIKIHKLSDKEFSEILVNRDSFTGKKLRILDQEARNRYFANKEFNGENDVYYNPDVIETVEDKRKNIALITSLAGVLLIVSLFFLISRNGNNEKSVELAVNNTEAPADEPKVNINEKPVGNKPEEENLLSPVVDKDKTSTSALSDDGNKILPTNQSTSSPDKSIENQELTDTRKTQETKMPVVNEVIKQEPGKSSTIQKTEEKKAPLLEEPKKNDPKNAIIENVNQTNKKPDNGSLDQRKIEAQDQKPNNDQSPAESSENVSKLPRENKISDLSTENLRQLVKFQNEWADKQTSLKGVEDYYVDGNIAIKFILNQSYTDSVNQYQQRFVPILTSKYWQDLEKALGAKFPRTPMKISYVKFDTEL